MAKSIKWRVSPAPTGAYKSFSKRQWPSAYYADDTPAASIECEDAYGNRTAKSGNHKPLKLSVADHSQSPWRWRIFKDRFTTLDEAKVAITKFIEKNPQFAKNFEAKK